MQLFIPPTILFLEKTTAWQISPQWRWQLVILNLLCSPFAETRMMRAAKLNLSMATILPFSTPPQIPPETNNFWQIALSRLQSVNKRQRSGMKIDNRVRLPCCELVVTLQWMTRHSVACTHLDLSKVCGNIIYGTLQTHPSKFDSTLSWVLRINGGFIILMIWWGRPFAFL